MTQNQPQKNVEKKINCPFKIIQTKSTLTIDAAVSFSNDFGIFFGGVAPTEYNIRFR